MVHLKAQHYSYTYIDRSNTPLSWAVYKELLIEGGIFHMFNKDLSCVAEIFKEN